MGHHYIPRDWFHYCFYWAVPEIILCCCKMATQWEEMDGWCICWSWCWIYWSWGLYQYLVIFILFSDSFISCYFLLQVQPDFIRLGNKVSQSQVVYTALKVSWIFLTRIFNRLILLHLLRFISDRFTKFN